MNRILVVANQTLGGEQLLQTLRDRVAAGPCRIHVLVPATSPPNSWSSSEEDERRVAQRRLEEALARFSTLGCEVDGEVGDVRPLDSVLDVLRREPADEIIVSTLAPAISRWLRMDLVTRVERAVDIPVTHIVGSPEPVDSNP